jgi:hypothetical protein
LHFHPQLNLFNTLQQHFQPTRSSHLFIDPPRSRSRPTFRIAAWRSSRSLIGRMHASSCSLRSGRPGPPDRGFIAQRGAARAAASSHACPLLRPTASVKAKPSSFQKTPPMRNQAQSKRDRAQRGPERPFQIFPFPSISGPESRVINTLRARGGQKLFSFPLPPGRRPALFPEFRRRASALPP